MLARASPTFPSHVLRVNSKHDAGWSSCDFGSAWWRCLCRDRFDRACRRLPCGRILNSCRSLSGLHRLRETVGSPGSCQLPPVLLQKRTEMGGAAVAFIRINGSADHHSHLAAASVACRLFGRGCHAPGIRHCGEWGLFDSTSLFVLFFRVPCKARLQRKRVVGTHKPCSRHWIPPFSRVLQLASISRREFFHD